jgi:2-keto-4-pentenoate hydratase/2-oxohepta-3-ene-1,7-dioic acid hydratase in catechol pathway
MKLVLYNDYRLGVIVGNRVVDAMAALAGQSFRRPQDMIETVIIEWATLQPKIAAATQGKDGMPLDSVKLRPPVPKPPKILCAAVNYLEFGQRSAADMDAFIKASTAVIGTGDTVELPPVEASIFHHEPELAVVIGKTATKV